MPLSTIEYTLYFTRSTQHSVFKVLWLGLYKKYSHIGHCPFKHRHLQYLKAQRICSWGWVTEERAYEGHVLPDMEYHGLLVLLHGHD